MVSGRVLIREVADTVSDFRERKWYDRVRAVDTRLYKSPDGGSARPGVAQRISSGCMRAKWRETTDYCNDNEQGIRPNVRDKQKYKIMCSWRLIGYMKNGIHVLRSSLRDENAS